MYKYWLPLITLLASTSIVSVHAQRNSIQLRNGAFSTTLLAPSGGNYTLTLPGGAGSSGQALVTDGNGGLSWGSAGASSLDALSDAKVGGTGFDGSMILGHQTTGAISGADAATLNTATGFYALKKITTGDQNTAYGTYSLQEITSGSWNTAVGAYAGWENSTAEYNTFVGAQAGMTVKVGSNNVGVGFNVMRNATNGGSHNTGVGNQALQSVNSGNYNIAVGSSAGILVGSGSNNVLIGYNAGNNLTSGSSNVLIGYQVGSGTVDTINTESNLLMIDNSNTATPLIYGNFSTDALTFNGSTTTTGNVTVGGGASASEVRFLEPSGSGSDYTAFKAQTQAANVTYTLPAADGTNGYVLTTNGSGSLSWAAASGGATNIDGLSDAKSGGTDFSNSLILGHQTTGTLNAASNNTSVGYGTIQAITSGDDNTAIGFNALYAVQDGWGLTAVGSGALQNASSASRTVAVGYQAGYNVVNAGYSVFVGYESGKSYVSTGASVGVGYRALYNATGAHNIAIGLETLVNTTGTNNIAIGSYTSGAVTGGSNNVAVGYGAAQKITSGSSNVILGNSAGPTNAVGNVSNKLYIHNSESDSPLIYGDFSGGTLTFNGSITTTGTAALNGNVTVGGGAAASEVRFREPSGSGSNYTAFKAQAQAADVTYTLPAADGTNGFVLTTNGSGTLSWAAASGGANAINDLTDAVKDITDFTGSMILGHQTTGTLSAAQYNTAVGMTAMDAITSGDENSVFGYGAGGALTSATRNTFVGHMSGQVATGSSNTGLGSYSLYSVTAGASNVAVGNQAGFSLTTTSYSIGIGESTYLNKPTGGAIGDQNIAIGYGALQNGTTGAYNIMIGTNAGTGSNNNSSANNVALGYYAGASLTTGSGNILIGYQAGTALTTESNQLYIDNSNTSLPLIQGDFNVDTLRFNGSTTTSGKTFYAPPVSSKTQTATTSTGAGAPDIATFTNTYEKATITATTAAGYVQLPAGTDGQIVYLRLLFTADASNSTVTIVNSNNNNTAMVYDGTGADVIVAHMLYTTGEGWVVFSALEYDNN